MNESVRTVLINSIDGHNGKVLYQQNGRNINLADADVRVEVYEKHYELRTLGGPTATKTAFVLAVTLNNQMRVIDLDFLNHVDRFILVADFLRTDGTFERMTFDDITLMSNIDLDNPESEWTFKVNLSGEKMHKLATF